MDKELTFKSLSPAGVLLYRLTIVMFLYSVCRLMFYAFNSDLFPGINTKLFGIIMMGGLRFDLSAILYLNLLYAFLQLIPFRFRQKILYQKTLDYIFFITNSIGLALNCIDFIYYRFTQRRTTLIILEEFKNEQNYLQLAKHFFLDYYYIFLIWIFLVAIMVGLVKKMRLHSFNLNGLKYYLTSCLILILFFGLAVIGIRGGLPPKQDFPLAPSDAGQYTTNPNQVAIIQNTPFCMIRLWKMPVYTKYNYYKEKELEAIYSPIHLNDSVREFKKMNVVILIIESLGKENLGFYNKSLDNGTYMGYTPFLDSLAEHSLVYMNSFANSRISIEASPSVLASIPSLQESYTLSFYANNKINSLASCLSAKGYETAFAHGAPNGSMGLSSFSEYAGVEKYIGANEYGDETDYDGVWGIWDHKFLPFFARACSKMHQPFLSILFSLSSHHPNKIPAELANQFLAGPLPNQKSIRYADYSLRKLFIEASAQPWFENTIFVITGDHTSTPFHEIYHTSIGDFGVPIIFYTPGKQIIPGKDFRVAQQIDIMPTILNFLGYDKPYFAFGKDLFNSNEDDIAFNYVGNAFQMIWGNWVIQHNGNSTLALYDRGDDPLLQKNLVGKNNTQQELMEQKVCAIIQQYNNRMVDNRLVP